MSTIKTGMEGEKLAANYLVGQGYEILELNYRYRRGEIDIIAKKDGLLIFVEVKYKSSAGFGFPEESVNLQKEQMIIKTADQYIYENSWEGMIRFDILSILNRKEGQELKHFKDAFY